MDLSALIGRACGQLTQRAADRAAGATEDDMGGLLFFGNPMETTPRRLLIDDRLSPVDKIGWMAFRMMASKDRETSFPSYQALQRLLSSRADGSQASKSTVNRVIFILRLTRWLSLCHQARNTTNGRMVGNIYALHDEPVAMVDAVTLDTGYIAFVGHCRNHGNQAVRKIANLVFDELAEDATVRYLMTRLGLFEERLKDHELNTARPRATAKQNRTQGKSQGSKFKLSETQNQTQAESPEFEIQTLSHTNPNPVENTGSEPRVRNSNSYTVRTEQKPFVVNVRTDGKVQSVSSAPPALDWSKLNLSEEERQVIRRYMTPLPVELHQPVIDEAVARMHTVRNMNGYLIGLIDRAKIGMFKVTTGAGMQLAQVEPHSPSLATAPVLSSVLPTPPPAPVPSLPHPVDIGAEIRAIRSLVGTRAGTVQPIPSSEDALHE